MKLYRGTKLAKGFFESFTEAATIITAEVCTICANCNQSCVFLLHNVTKYISSKGSGKLTTGKIR